MSCYVNILPRTVHVLSAVLSVYLCNVSLDIPACSCTLDHKYHEYSRVIQLTSTQPWIVAIMYWIALHCKGTQGGGGGMVVL